MVRVDVRVLADAEMKAEAIESRKVVTLIILCSCELR